MKLHGVVVSAALNCIQASFCNWLYIPCFPIWRSKANFNDLFYHIGGHFISMLHKYFEIEHVIQLFYG